VDEAGIGAKQRRFDARQAAIALAARVTELALIVAADRRGVIGRAGGLPWHLPNDLKRFKSLTLGKPIIMGRKTWDSIGKPLPGRHSIVITRQPELEIAGATVVRSLEDALRAAGGAPEVCVIGGAEIFRLALPSARRIELTVVEAEVAGDTYLPALDPAEWLELVREPHPADERHAYPYTFVTLRRRG
jgi:dihydrofolate reductase